MMKPEEVIDRVRARLTPSSSPSAPSSFVELLQGLLDAAQVKARAMLGGSFAKGTYLEGDHDIDVFVRFDPSYSDEEMPDLLGLALGGWEGLRRVHGSRDYFQLDKEGFSFEIVPVLDVSSSDQARNVTDMSPLHVRHVKEAIGRDPLLAADIRAAKLFCKAAKVYGAESYINGFSGHVLDNLVIHYGSFLGLLRAAAQWPERVVIDASGEGRSASSLSPAKRAGPLVLLDPVQPDRNAAAALSKDRFDAFRESSRRFLAAPEESFFTVTVPSKDAVLSRHSGRPVLAYALRPLEGSKDVAGTKLLKAHQFVLRRAKAAGFSVVEEGFEFSGEEAFCFIVAEEEPLPPTLEVAGPPLSQRKDADRFRQAHPGRAEEREGRLVALEPRPVRTLESLFSVACQDSYFSARVAGAKVI